MSDLAEHLGVRSSDSELLLKLIVRVVTHNDYPIAAFVSCAQFDRAADRVRDF